MKIRNNPIPDHLLTTPSTLINDLKDYFDSTAKRYVPQFSLQSAITYISHLTARNYMTTSGLKPEMYSMIVGSSGVGKGYNAKAITGIDTLHTRIVTNATSESGLRTAMCTDGASLLALIDEMGDKFNPTGQNNKEFLAGLREIYNNNIWLQKSFSGFKQGQMDTNLVKYNIKSPALSILGMSTEEQLHNGLTAESISNGTANRFIIVNAFQSEVIRNRLGLCTSGLTTELHNKLCAISKRKAVHELWNESPEIEYISFDDGVENYFDDIHDEMMLEKNGAYNVRTIENSVKVAMNITIANSQKSIPMNVAKWSIDYCSYWGYNIKKLSESVNPTVYAGQVERLSLKLAESGNKGIEQWKLNKFCRESLGLKNHEREGLIKDLMDDKLITLEDGSKSIKNGKVKKLYKYIGSKRK